jgi:putative SOS response-associated peptidase YedK
MHEIQDHLRLCFDGRFLTLRLQTQLMDQFGRFAMVLDSCEYRIWLARNCWDDGKGCCRSRNSSCSQEPTSISSVGHGDIPFDWTL